MTLKLQTTTNEKKIHQTNALAAENKLAREIEKNANWVKKCETSNNKNEQLISIIEQLRQEFQAQKKQKEEQMLVRQSVGGNFGMRGGGGKRPNFLKGAAGGGQQSQAPGRMTYNPGQ